MSQYTHKATGSDAIRLTAKQSQSTIIKLWFNCISPCLQLVRLHFGPFLNFLQECYKRHFKLKNRVWFGRCLLLTRLQIGRS